MAGWMTKRDWIGTRMSLCLSAWVEVALGPGQCSDWVGSVSACSEMGFGFAGLTSLRQVSLSCAAAETTSCTARLSRLKPICWSSCVRSCP
jgi:hypothetical protein